MLSRWQRLRMRGDLALGRSTTLSLEGSTPALHAIFDAKAGLRRVATGLQFTEGPVWHAREERLLFTDIPGNCIHQLTANGVPSVRHAPSDHANGLTFDAQGRLLACEHGTRRVSRRELDGRVVVVADSFEGTRLNSPNDLIARADGSIWFTDPPYGIAPEAQVLPFQGVFRATAAGDVQLVFRDFDRPNGLAFSSDGSTLYVADSSARRHIRVFALDRDGMPSAGNVFVDMAIAEQGVPDGLKVALNGVVFSTGPGGVWVIEPTGRVLGILQIPETTSNCAFGDADGCGLYITATTSVYHVRLRAPAIEHVAAGPPT